MKEAQVGTGHHLHYDEDITTPTCDRCHVEITAINCAASRIVHRRLTTAERLRGWTRFFVDGFSVFVRNANKGWWRVLDIPPSSVLASLEWLGLLKRAQKSMNIKFPQKGVMEYDLPGGMHVFHLHSEADEEYWNPERVKCRQMKYGKD